MINSVLRCFYRYLPSEERGEFIAWLSVLFGGSPEVWKNRSTGRSNFTVDEKTEVRLTGFLVRWKEMRGSNALKFSSPRT